MFRLQISNSINHTVIKGVFTIMNHDYNTQRVVTSMKICIVVFEFISYQHQHRSIKLELHEIITRVNV